MQNFDFNKDTRFLLCRPEGGLNDILSVIGKAIPYCKQNNRVLLIETDSADAQHFRSSFSEYFVSDDRRIILNTRPYAHLFDQMEILPAFLRGRVSNYNRSMFGPGEIAQLELDFTRDYDVPLVLHHQNGRRKKRDALVALSHLRLREELLGALRERLRIIAGPYSAFHVRHTDYKTDFENYVSKLAPNIKGPVFLATDNRVVVEFFQDVFGKSRLYTFSELPEKAGVPLHYSDSVMSAYQRNSEAVLDLFTLTLAQDYFLFPRRTDRFQILPAYSGFSSLAARLRLAPHVLQHVLQDQQIPKISFSERVRRLRFRYY